MTDEDKIVPANILKDRRVLRELAKSQQAARKTRALEGQLLRALQWKRRGEVRK